MSAARARRCSLKAGRPRASAPARPEKTRGMARGSKAPAQVVDLHDNRRYLPIFSGARAFFAAGRRAGGEEGSLAERAIHPR